MLDEKLANVCNVKACKARNCANCISVIYLYLCFTAGVNRLICFTFSECRDNPAYSQQCPAWAAYEGDGGESYCIDGVDDRKDAQFMKEDCTKSCCFCDFGEIATTKPNPQDFTLEDCMASNHIVHCLCNEVGDYYANGINCNGKNQCNTYTRNHTYCSTYFVRVSHLL